MPKIKIKYKNGITKILEENEFNSLQDKSNIATYTKIENKSIGSHLDKKEKLKNKQDISQIAQRMWFNMKNRPHYNSDYAGIDVKFTQLEFYEFILPKLEEFFHTYGFEARPSVDRIDSNGDYCAENIQIIPIGENISKKFRDSPEHLQRMREMSKENFSKKVKLTLVDGTEKIYNSSYDVDREFGKHRSYTYWRLTENNHRELPPEWQSIEYFDNI